MTIENIDDYLVHLKNYEDGNYEYETIHARNDVEEAVTTGKKLVYLKCSPKGFMLTGLFIFTIGLFVGLILLVVLSVDLTIKLNVFSIILGIFGLSSLGYIISRIYSSKQEPDFFIIGSEGIVYKFPKDTAKGFKWDEISLGQFGGNTSSNFLTSIPTTFPDYNIIISMPNGDIIIPEYRTFQSKEYLLTGGRYKIRENFHNLEIFTLETYYHHGKREKNEEFKKKVYHFMDTRDYLTSDDCLTSLTESYQNYKHKKYDYGKYVTSEQILADIIQGKKFVLKGSVIWGLVIAMWVLGIFFWLFFALLPGSTPEVSSFLMLGGFYFFLLFFLFSLLGLLPLGYVLVMSPCGVYYRKCFLTGFFLWDDIYSIKGVSRLYRGTEQTWVKIILSNYKRII